MMIILFRELLWVLIVNFVIQCSRTESCKGICCTGMNSSCHVVNITTGKKCFCDKYCFRSRDCCLDFVKECKDEIVINCILSNWQKWSYCPIKCGSSIQKRTRKILIPPSVTGQKCAHISESRICKGIICPAQSQSYKPKKSVYYPQVVSSTILILPDLISPALIYKRYSYKHGIRRHMYLRNLRQNNMTEIEKSNPYCNIYQITMTLGNCHSLQKLSTTERANWSEHAMYLMKDNTICVTCYPHNQHVQLKGKCKGSSHPVKESRWRAIRSDNCHGFFKLLTKRKNCKCKQPSFLMI